MTKKQKAHRISVPVWLWRNAQNYWSVADPTPQLTEWLNKSYEWEVAHRAKEARSKTLDQTDSSTFNWAPTVMRGRGFTACVDCSVCTMALGEDYVVNDDIWQQVGMSERGGMLCIGCLEDRLGRKLWGCDFTEAPINDPNHFPKSTRLRARLTDFSQLILLIDHTGTARAWAEAKSGWICNVTGDLLAFVAFHGFFKLTGAQTGWFYGDHIRDRFGRVVLAQPGAKIDGLDTPPPKNIPQPPKFQVPPGDLVLRSALPPPLKTNQWADFRSLFDGLGKLRA
jgi:hypothetical protein